MLKILLLIGFLLFILAFIFFFRILIFWNESRKRNCQIFYFISSAFLSFILFVTTVFLYISKPETPSLNKQKQIQYLKKIEPDSLAISVPEKFYSNSGFRDWYRVPLVYPYSLNWIDTYESGGLVYDEKNVKDINWSNDGHIQVIHRPIHKFFFNRHYLFAEYYLDDYKKDSINYYILHFGSNKLEEISERSEFNKRAEELGFLKMDSLMTLMEYYKKFE